MALVAIAGPLANLAMVFGWAVLLKIALGQPATGTWVGLKMMASAGITFNLVLMALNLLPVPPLDGSRVLASLLPPRLSYRFSQIEPYGLLILVVLMFSRVLGPILIPVMALGQSFVFTVLNIA
jgi:Zn-dependent protease